MNLIQSPIFIYSPVLVQVKQPVQSLHSGENSKTQKRYLHVDIHEGNITAEIKECIKEHYIMDVFEHRDPSHFKINTLNTTALIFRDLSIHFETFIGYETKNSSISNTFKL